MGRIRNIDERLLAWILLAVAMCASATWLMLAGSPMTFSGDDIFYYARFIEHSGSVAPGNGLEYFFAPHNGHLQVLGKLIYRGLFLTIGADYAVFRAIEVAAVLTCVVLFFILVRRRVRPLAALIPCVLLLFYGTAEQSLLWAFSLHTIGALALGLGALLTLERGDRRGDVATCALLVLSIATVELGLAFAVGAGVAVLLRSDRWRRIWIALVPIALFGIWWLWARRFHPPGIDLANVHLIPIDFTNALAAIAGSVFGLNPTGPGVDANVTSITTWGTVIAALALAGLALRVRRGQVPDGLWIALAILLSYWMMITLAGRPPDSTRYIFAGTVLVLLIAANALRGMRVTAAALIVSSCLVALAIPPNLAKFYDERRSSVTDAENTRTEYAMVEFTRHTVSPDYMPAADPQVGAAGGSVFIPLSAGEYLRAAGEFGSLAYSLAEVRGENVQERTVADATLVGALGIGLAPAQRPSAFDRCPSSLEGRPDHTVYFFLPRGGALLGSRSKQPVSVAIGRFGEGGSGVPLGQLDPHRWGRLAVPPDSAPDRWWAVVNGPVYVCGLGSRAAG